MENGMQRRRPPHYQGWSRPGPGRVLTLLGLQFDDPVLERRYVDVRTFKLFCRVDAPAALMRMLASGSIALRLFRDLGLHSLAAAGATGVGLFCVAQALVCRVMFQEEAYREEALQRIDTTERRRRIVGLRTLLAMLLRAVMFPLVITTSYSAWFPARFNSSLSCLYFMWINSGLFALVIGAIVVPLLVKHSLLVQAISLLAACAFQGRRTCDVCMQSEQGPKYILWLWRCASNASWTIQNLMYLTDVREVTEPEPLPACRHIITNMFLIGGMVFPSYLLWVMEYRSRVYFLETQLAADDRRGRRQQQQEEPGAIEPWSKLTNLLVTYHVLLLVIFFAVSWETMSDRFIDRGDRCFVVNGVLSDNCSRVGEGLHQETES